MRKVIERIYWFFWKRNAIKVDPRFHIRNIVGNLWQDYLKEK